MASYPREMQSLIDELVKLPGLGPRSAQRILYHLLKSDAASVQALIQAIREFKAKIRFCLDCGNLTTQDHCRVCRDPRRDRSILCVVEEPKDVVALEATGAYRGVYHVLMGKIVPLEGIGVEDIRVRELVSRLKKSPPSEVILATGSDVEGETTSLYLARLLRPLKVKITRLATGIPVGSSLDFVDPSTLIKAIEGRRDF